jgi:hypothetical protein
MFALQTRKPGKAYRTVRTAQTFSSLHWAFNQYLTPNGRDSVRVVNAHGAVIVRATPKGA